MGDVSFGFSPAAERARRSYPWPGNIHQLKHCIARACEKQYIEDVLAANEWPMGKAAGALGISRKTLWEKMRRHGIADRGKGGAG